MQERVEKYIYYIADDFYRVKFKKVDKNTHRTITFDQYVRGNLEKAIELRDEKLKEYGFTLEQEQKKEEFVIESKEELKPKLTKSKSKTNIKKAILVDKYIYEIIKGKKYRILIRKGGASDYYSETIECNLAQAKRIRDKKLAEFKLNKTTINKDNIKFVDFCKIYFKEYAEVELRVTTICCDRQTLNTYILPHLANITLKKLDVLTLQKFFNRLKEQDKLRPDKDGKVNKLSIVTIDNVYRILRKILNKACSWGFLAKNPIKEIKAPNVNTVEKTTYNNKELFRVFELLEKEKLEVETSCLLELCTGMRREEIGGLHVKDIDFKNGEIKLDRVLIYNKITKETEECGLMKTDKSRRVIPVPDFCLEKIKEYLKLRERKVELFKKKNPDYVEIDNLFLGRKGGFIHPDTSSDRWRNFLNKHSELKYVTFHGLRHSYCSLQINNNTKLSVSDVQKLMGHTQLTTTFGYTHSNEKKNEEAVSIFNQIYKDTKQKKVNFNMALSLYTGVKGKKFVSNEEINEVLDFVIINNVSVAEKYKVIKNYLNKNYPFFADIDTDKVNINNVWNWLNKQKIDFGDEFVLSQLIA